MNIDITYKGYNDILSDVDCIFSDFKKDKIVTDILEHVSINFGILYKSLIENEFKKQINNYIELININDSIGSPNKEYIFDYHISPSNLRYIYHSLLIESKIKKWFNNKKSLNILEIGGGYGGLSFYIKNIISDINLNYTIVDLPNVCLLQKRFLKEVNLTNVNIISCLDYFKSNQKYDLIISNYCLSEISIENRFLYLDNIYKNCEKEFYVWNSTNLDGLCLNKYEIESETPQTNYDGYNKFIYSKM